jgi:hypothetical protein
MNDTVPPIEQCDVCNKASLASYRTKKAQWWRWLRTDNQNALWPQIYAMIIEDMTFRTLVAAADADKESGLHSPIIRRGILQGNAATQGLAIRRLADEKNISLRRLLRNIKENIHLITRENYVSGEGLPYDSNADANWSAHLKFDRLAGTQPKSRSRADRIPKRVIKILEGWLDAKEIREVVKWTNTHIAHAADPENARTDVTPLTMDNIAVSQRNIVRTAEAVSAYLLNGPIQGAIIPVFRYSQFSRFEMIVNREAVKKAQERWRELAEERDQWTQGIWEELLAIL